MASPRSLRGPTQPHTPSLRAVLSALASGELRTEPDRIGAPGWPERKQRLLVDSVLRGWPIGPIYVLAEGGKVLTVVDGAQRIFALLAFVQGTFAVDGMLTPADTVLREVDKLRYAELPSGLRRAFLDYPMVLVELSGMNAADVRPALLRLNGDDQLTPAQRRVTEAGGLGEQVRNLVTDAADWGLEPARIGFSNVGLAYDDVITRMLAAVEARDIRAASQDLDIRVKSGKPVADDVVQQVSAAVRAVLALPSVDGAGVRFSKATLLSWLLLFVHAGHLFGPAAAHYAGHLLEWFERQRRRVVAGLEETERPPVSAAYQKLPHRELLKIFNEFAAVDAMGAETIVQRDVVLWLFLAAVGGIPSASVPPGPRISRLCDELIGDTRYLRVITRAAHDPDWGRWA